MQLPAVNNNHKVSSSHASNSSLQAVSTISSTNSLKLVSFNIQAGIETNSYKDYFKNYYIGQFFPTQGRTRHLNKIGNVVNPFDIVALQEVDAGSRRSGFINQIAYLAQQGNFSYWHQQVNRDFGSWGKYCNGLLSRFKPYKIETLPLPGLIKGRGAIFAHYGTEERNLLVISVHLALGTKTRSKQLEFISSILGDAKHAIIMGDLNCSTEDLQYTSLAEKGFHWEEDLHTYPSWEPKRNIDHILVSSTLTIDKVEVLPEQASDHRAIAMEIKIPAELQSVVPEQEDPSEAKYK